ncbi:NAD(P)H-dependent flavin oxidoreductase [Kordiimonas pumila]|uniref:NAD(P)H-dependent flavin oxidoreductase n=1 Tax=Kordiimonas pumila TaxID=2161677 RepID=A0ABV7D5Q0_9PROT|nr:nitronate monooxygenase family protein [Kordiimonas pumila]
MADTYVNASVSNRFTQEYGLAHPFACAGLAFAGMTPPLAIAVSKVGALGAVGIGKMPAPYIEFLVNSIRAATDGPFNVNFITIFTEDSHIAMCEKLKPAVVSFHWGHPPKSWISRLQAAGIKVWEQVGSVDAAKLAVDEGIDLIIAQGTEAGGHNLGTLPLFVLLPEIIDAVAPVMVLAAGAISDGRGVAGALAMGADGVWVGTRMAATVEADIVDSYKTKMLQSEADDAVLSSLFGRDTLDFNPMRLLRNKIVEEWQGREEEAPVDPFAEELLGTMKIGDMELPLHKFSNMMPMSTATADVEQMPLLAGQGVGLIKTIEPAGVVVEKMMADAKAILQKLGKAAG